MKIKITENNNGESGIDIVGKDNQSLYFIPDRHLCRLEHDYKLLNEEKGTVLLQVVRVAKFNWASKELLSELTKIIHDRSLDMEANIFADTFSAVLQFEIINEIWNQFNKDIPFATFNGSKIDWKNQFWEYLKKISM